jgi:ABC-type uncharacterized transport system substrate-binding protein
MVRPDDKQAARIMVVMQRIHVDDLVGYLLENEAGFEVLSLPSIAQSTTIHDLGGGRTHTREKGDLLHPAHEPAEVLREIKKSMGAMLFSAQYQQAPEPAGGTIIKRKMLRYYSELERLPTDRIVMSWDIALSEQEAGDYSVCVVLLSRGDSYYVLEVIRGIVIASAADPFIGGLVKNLSRPGGNITGFASMERDISSKVFEILKEMVAGLSRIAVLAAPAIRDLFAPGQDQAARALGIEYSFIDMPQPGTVGAAMDQALAGGAQGAVVRGSPFFSSEQRRQIIDSAAQHRLPTIYERRNDAEQGGLVSYAPDVEDQFRATADYVVRILAGANPADLPIQQPTKFEMAINLKTAKVLGLQVPPTLQASADLIIE